MASWIDELLASGPVVADGAWGTQLQSLVELPSGRCPDELNLTHPRQVEQVPRAYVAAGSRVILTNTFRANRIALADYGLAEQAVAINQAGAAISRRAADDAAKVCGSIGPSGKLLFAEEVTADELYAAFAEQAAALAAAGVDALVIETMADLDEACVAVTAARTTGLPVVASMVFDSGRDQDRTMTGRTPEEAAAALAAAGADVIGANCGQGIASYVAICRRLRHAADRPIWIKANAGLPQVEGDRVSYRDTPQQFAAHAPALVAAGASFLGGCCGTNPDHIRALREQLGR